MFGGAEPRKRKGDLLVEDPERRKRSGKSQRLLVEDDDETCADADSRTNGPVLLGAKSGIGREATNGRKMNTGNGLELNSLTEKEGGIPRGIWTKERRNK